MPNILELKSYINRKEKVRNDAVMSSNKLKLKSYIIKKRKERNNAVLVLHILLRSNLKRIQKKDKKGSVYSKLAAGGPEVLIVRHPECSRLISSRGYRPPFLRGSELIIYHN